MIVPSHRITQTGAICPYGLGRCPGAALGCPCPRAGMRGLGLSVAGFDLSQEITIPGINVQVSIQNLLIGAAVIGLGVAALGMFGGGKSGRRSRLRRAGLEYQKRRAEAMLA